MDARVGVQFKFCDVFWFAALTHNFSPRAISQTCTLTVGKHCVSQRMNTLLGIQFDSRISFGRRLNSA